MRPPLASETSEGAQGFFSKITFLKSEVSNENDEVCYGFLVNIFTKSLFTGGVDEVLVLSLVFLSIRIALKRFLEGFLGRLTISLND